MLALSIVVGIWLLLNTVVVVALTVRHGKTRGPRIVNPIDNPC
jgi:hypothetical protein